MKLTKDIILNHIRRSKAYLWSLFLIQNYRKTHILSYKGDGITDSDNEDSKAEKSISRLLSILADFPQSTIFAIELKASNTANGNGVIGPLEFVNSDKQEEQQPQQQTALNGIAALPQGYVSEEYLNGKLAELKADNTKQLGELMLNYERKEFNNEKQRTLQRLEEKEKELENERKKYESNTGAAAEALFMAIKKFVQVFTTPQTTLNAPEPQQPQPQTEEERRKTAVTETLANYMYDNFNSEQISNFYKTIKKNVDEKISNNNAADNTHGTN